MENKKKIKNHKLIVNYFNYFYAIVKNKLILSLFSSILISLLDGIGLGLIFTLVQEAIQPANKASYGLLIRINSLLQDAGIDSIQFKTLVIVALCIFLFKAILYYYHLNLQVKINTKIINDTRINLINKVSDLSYAGFLKMDAGTFQNISSNEVNRLNSAVITLLNTSQFILMGLTYIILATFTNYKFSFIVIFILILTSLFYKRLFKSTRRLSTLVSLKSNIFSSYISQILSNFKYLKATNSITKYREKLKQQIHESTNINYRLSKLNTLTVSLREPVILFLIIIILYFYSLFNGQLTFAIILPIILLYKTISYTIIAQTNWQNFNQFSGSINNILTALELLNKFKEVNNSNYFHGFQETIELNNIYFSYNNKIILKDINLQIQKNRTIAIVGQSGSGKTTLASIINGLLIPDRGQVLIDASPLTSYNLESYRSKVGYVSQDPVIFNDSFFNNITLWADKSGENMELFNQITTATNLTELISEGVSKEDQLLGDNGIKLSGGQKQRVSIARELFKNVEIMVLDEATSSLDTLLENNIQINLQKIRTSVTFIIIAHRLSTIKNADSIILLTEGKIEQQGNFQELYDNSTPFKKMVDMQIF